MTTLDEKERLDDTTGVDAYIPDDDEVNTSAGMPTWRVANGALCQGREEDHNLVTREKIVGLLKRIGRFSGMNDKTGEPFDYLEVDLTTRAGPQRVRTKVTTVSSTQTLLRSLLQVAANELIAIAPKAAKEKNKYGKYSTYANVYKVDPHTKASKYIDTKTERTDQDSSEIIEALFEEIKKHPSYQEREKHQSEEDAGTEIAELFEEFQGKVIGLGWPAVPEAKNEYLGILSRGLKKEVKDFSDLTASDWRFTLDGLKEAKAGAIPKPLQAIAERLSQSGSKFDAFADE